MKKIFQALVMLCVLVLVYMIHGFNVNAKDCGGVNIILLQDEIKVELNGEEPNYEDFVKVVDDCNTDITNIVQVNVTDTVNVNIPGNYEVGYMVGYGGKVDQEKLRVVVKEDIINPELNGYHEKYFFIKDSDITADDFLTDVTATDNKDGDVTDDITIDISNIDSTAVGKYEAKFSVADSSDNLTEVTVEVHIIESELLLIKGLSNITYEVNQDEPDYNTYITVYDEYKNDVEIFFDTDDVEYDVIGSYNVTFTVKYYNIEETKTVTINIVDTEKPTITGAKKITIEKGDYFNPFKYFTVEDNYDDEDDIELKISGHYSIDEIGEYDLVAIAKDKSGNEFRYNFQLKVVKAEKSNLVLWVSVILGVVVVGASGTLYFIRKKKGNL